MLFASFLRLRRKLDPGLPAVLRIRLARFLLLAGCVVDRPPSGERSTAGRVPPDFSLACCVVGDPEANALLRRPYRAPWVYPEA